MEEQKRKSGKTGRRRIWRWILALSVLLAAVPVCVLAAAKMFTAQESVVRSSWEIDAGAVLDRDEEHQIEFARADLGEDGIRAFYLVPEDLEEEGFTFYDTAVQRRLSGALETLKKAQEWTAENPLAVVNPYGTGSNGLYLYFTTDQERQVTYTVHVEKEGIPDFTARAANAGQRVSGLWIYV